MDSTTFERMRRVSHCRNCVEERTKSRHNQESTRFKALQIAERIVNDFRRPIKLCDSTKGPDPGRNLHF